MVRSNAWMGWMTAAVAAVALLGGCSQEPRPEQVAVELTAAGEYKAIFDVAQEVLQDYQFRIDRADRRAGLIETRPLTGKSFFEVWRKDAVTAHDTAESTLQTIYRKAIVRVTGDEQAGYDFDVRVAVSRADRKNLQITNTSQAFALFSLERGHRRYRKTRGLAGEDRLPVELVDDEKLALQIQREIAKRLADRPLKG